MISQFFSHRYGLFFLLFVTVTLGSLYFWYKDGLSQEAVFPNRVVVAGREFILETAITQEEHSRGLGGREALCDTCGMLFVFETLGAHGFWMAEMRFPLDIIWLRDDTIVHIKRRLVPEETPEVYRPPIAANQVLELNAGASDGLREGEKVQFLFSE